MSSIPDLCLSSASIVGRTRVRGCNVRTRLRMDIADDCLDRCIPCCFGLCFKGFPFLSHSAGPIWLLELRRECAICSLAATAPEHSTAGGWRAIVLRTIGAF
jgi:hypothetical protein